MEAVARLLDREYNGYLRRKIPHPLDDAVKVVIEDYLSRDAVGRRLVLDAIQPRAAGVLSAYGQRMAVMAVRNSSSELLTLGVVAAGIGQPMLSDRRDNLRVLAALNDAAERVGQHLADILRDVRGDIPGAAYSDFTSFCERSARDKSIASMGMGVAGSGSDFHYVAHRN